MFLSSTSKHYVSYVENEKTDLSRHSDLETITEIDMNDFPAHSVHQQIRRMTISQSENVSYHRHDRESTTVIAPSIEPSFRIPRFEPEYSVEVLSCRVVECVFEHFEFLHEAEMVEVRRHLQNESMFDVEEDLATVSVVLDENMQRIGTVDPSEQTGIRRERNDGVFDDREMSLERFGILLEKRIDETE